MLQDLGFYEEMQDGTQSSESVLSQTKLMMARLFHFDKVLF